MIPRIMRGVRGLLCAVVLSCLVAVPARAQTQQQPGCGGDTIPIVTAGPMPPCYPWQGSWEQRDVVVPSRIAAIGSYAGTMMSPVGTEEAGVTLPAIVVLHGYQGQKHNQYWATRYLASLGYVVLGVTAPSNGENGNPDDYVEAALSMIDFLGTDANPLRSITDVTRIGAAGHSQGARAVSAAQAVDDRIDAIVAWDNLASDLWADDGSAIECPVAGTGLQTRVPPRQLPVIPRAPALGLAEDLPCARHPANGDPDQKKSGYRAWRDASPAVPAVLIVEAGSHHFNYDQGADDAIDAAINAGGVEATEAYFHRFAVQTGNWFDAWLRGRSSALLDLLGASTLDVPRDEVISAKFRSAAYVPSLGIDCEDLRSCPTLPQP